MVKMYCMIDYADLAITLDKLNLKFYRDAERVAQKIKEYEDYYGKVKLKL